MPLYSQIPSNRFSTCTALSADCQVAFWVPSISGVVLALLLAVAAITISFAQVINPAQVGVIQNGSGTIPALGDPKSVYVSGNFAYVASAGSNALEIVDITLPGAPIHKGSLTNGTGGALLDGPNSVYVSGNYAYVTSERSNALEIVDVTNRGAPVHKGSLTNGTGGALLNGPLSVYVSVNYAYVASSGSNALEIVDVSNPAVPVHKGSLTHGTGGALLVGPNSVFASGNYAYLTSAGSNALEIVDVTNPGAPVHKGSLTSDTGGALLDSLLSVHVSGNYAYVVSVQPYGEVGSPEGLEIVDITNPGAPVHKGSIELFYPQSVYVSGNYAYVACYTRLEIVDVTNPAAPVLKGSLGVLSTSVYISGNYAYVTSAFNALEIVDVTNRGAPVLKGSLINGSGGALLFNPISVYVSGNYAYVTSSGSSSGTLEIVDVTNPGAPVHKGSLTGGSGGALLDGASSVYVSGNYAYVASYASNALEIVDVTNPAAPVHKGSLTDGMGGALLSNPNAVYVSGNYAYVASSGSNALEIIDVTNPGAPVHKGSLTDGMGGALLSSPASVYVSGNYAYVASLGSDALEIIDVTNPDAPVHKGSLTNGTGGALLNFPSSVYVSGNYAYVGSYGSNALEIVDVTNPDAPVHKGSLTDGMGGALLSSPISIYVSGNYAYVGSYGSHALEIVDVTNPAAPVRKGSLTNGKGGASLSSPSSVFVSGNYAYVASFGSNALSIIYNYAPVISAFTPSGAVGTTVSINGQNFNTFVRVEINGMPATISEVTETTLTITVPAGASIGLISVSYNGIKETSSNNFIVTPTTSAAASFQQTSFTANWSDVGAAGYFLDVSTDNFNTFVGAYNNFLLANVTSYQVEGLSPGTTYQYRVRSSDGTMSSGNSNAITAFTIPATPVTNAATQITQTGFRVNWNSVLAATGYYLDVAYDIGFTNFLNGINNSSISSTTQVVSGAGSGVRYYYRVRSGNVSGVSPSSAIDSVITIPTNPLAIPGSSVTATGFTASWSSVIGSDSYYLDVSSDNFITLITGYNNKLVGSNTSYDLTGLSSGTNYQYRVRASNASGSSGNSNIVSLITLPAIPVANTATNITQNSFGVSWTAVTGAASYSIDVATDNGFLALIYNNINVNNVSSFALSSLSPGTTHYFRLRANNASGSSENSNIISATTFAQLPSSQSTGITFSGITSTSFTINYNPGNGASHLTVISAEATLNSLPIDGNNYTPNTLYGEGSPLGAGYVVGTGVGPITVTGLSPATTYYVQVFDFNGSGGTENYNTVAAANNPASQLALSTIPTEQPTALAFSNQTGTSVNVSFTPANGNPTGYLVLRSSGTAPTATPVQGIPYSIGTTVGNATVASSGASISFFDGGLPTSTKYYYSIYAFNGGGASVSYLTASPLQGNVTLDVIPPVITALNSSTIDKSSTPTFAASITDNVGVAAAQLFYKGISQKEFKVAAMNSLGSNNYSVTVQTDWYDEMGLEYYFMASDENENQTSKPASANTAQLVYKSPILLPALPSGTGLSDYRIKSFPYQLKLEGGNKVPNVYPGVPWNDNTKAAMWWWNSALKNGSGEYEQYGSPTSFQTVDPGKGYWIIVDNAPNISLSNVEAPKYNHTNLFKMTLKPKWNEIGNPYPVPISWDDVKAFNPNVAFSSLTKYDGTGYKDAKELEAFEGGFVMNLGSSDITVQIPFPGQTSTGGRVGAIGSDISQDDWNIFLHIDQNGFTNQLGGFGMHPLAQSGKDRYDNFNPPRFLDIPEVNFTNQESGATFSNDMVKSQENYTWQFTPAGIVGKPAQLNWNPGITNNSTRQLFLFDEELVKVIDMSSVSQYHFTLTKSSRFHILYGDKITTPGIAMSEPYPNPLTHDALANINVALPESSRAYDINLQVYNAQGDLIESMNKTLTSGIHRLEFTLAGEYLKSGMYFYRLSVIGEKKSSVQTGKIVKP